MRLTLEQLKGMSDKGLREHWLNWQFPFDQVPGGKCTACLEMHSGRSLTVRFIEAVACWNPEHKKLRSMMPTDPKLTLTEYLRVNLEELYALRLFCEMQTAPETPAEVKESASEQNVCRL